jgi:uncharacterized protein (TIRG00374 family)
VTDLDVSSLEHSEKRQRSWVATAALCAAGLVSLWLLRSSIAAVYGDLGDIAGIDPRWLVAVVGCEAAAFVSSWDLNRVALRTDGWFDVAVAQLTGNAATNLVPAGGAAGVAVQLRVLSEAGFDLTRAATSLGALSILGTVGLLALPVVALPSALAAGTNDPRLEAALWVGVVLLLVCLGVAAVLLTRDGPLERLSAAVQWIRNRLLPRDARGDLPARVLAERDAISVAIWAQPARVVAATVGRTAGDFFALYLSLLAVGVHPTPTVVLIAFSAGNVAGMIPLTPGGLGFVEAGITGVLVASGIDPAHAALAAALYRVANTWLPVLAGLLAYVAFHRRHQHPTAQALVGPGSELGAPSDAQRNIPLPSTPISTTQRGPPAGAAIADEAPSRRAYGSRRLAMIAVTALALVLVSPVLVKVYGHIGDTFKLGPGWLLAIAAVIVAHFLSVWALYRVILRTSNRFDVAASQLAANATSHVAPAGSAVGAGIQLRMLTIAGFSASRAATALGATAVLGTVAGYIVLPLGVLGASAARGGVPARLVGAMWSAAAVLAVLLMLTAVLSARDWPWRWAAKMVAWAQRRFGRKSDAREVSDRLINERNLIRGAIRERALFVAFLAFAQPLTDYAALYLSLLAVGANVNPAAAMGAFVVSNVAGLVPLTPGGLGFVEAGLTRVLVIAGATRPEAHVAIVTYRLAATWLPCLAGFVAVVLFQRRHRRRRAHSDVGDESADAEHLRIENGAWGSQALTRPAEAARP